MKSKGSQLVEILSLVVFINFSVLAVVNVVRTLSCSLSLGQLPSLQWCSLKASWQPHSATLLHGVPQAYRNMESHRAVHHICWRGERVVTVWFLELEMYESVSPELFICTSKGYNFKNNFNYWFLSYVEIKDLNKTVCSLLHGKDDLHVVCNMITLGS